MILVTGGTGTSGADIVRELSSRGVKFRALARNPAKADDVRLPGVEIVQGDMSNARSLEEPLAGVDVALLHSAAASNFVDLQCAFIDAAKKAGVKRIVKFSALGADPKSTCRFQQGHAVVEDKLKSSGLTWTMLQPTFFMQNLLGQADMIKSGTIYQPAGDGKSAYVDTRDIASVAVVTLTQSGHEGKSYPITGPADLSFHDIAATFSKVLGRQIKYVDVPAEAARESLAKMGLPAWNVDGILELMDLLRSGKTAGLFRTVKQIAGKVPRTLERFVRDHASAFNG